MFGEIIKMSKGRVITTHAAGTSSTTTSAALTTNDIQMNNALLVKVDISGSGAWTIKLQGMLEAGGTMADLYDSGGTLMSTGSITTSILRVFRGIPENIQVVATEDSGTATVTVKVQPITI